MNTSTNVTPVARTDRAVNNTIRWLTDRGLNLAGAQTLAVRGRRTGATHRLPVNPLTIGDAQYLVAPRGLTDWVKNVRVTPQAELRRGRQRAQVTLREVTDLQRKVAVLSSYLQKWGWEVGRLLPAGVTPDADAATLAAHVDSLPVFEIRRD